LWRCSLFAGAKIAVGSRFAKCFCEIFPFYLFFLRFTRVYDEFLLCSGDNIILRKPI
jgi:hypothetical protein